MSKNRRLYPPLETAHEGHLRVSPIHELFYEVSGAINGKPVVVCHGGPGGGTTASMRRYFDPKRYKIILFDQRGCGRSTPHASLEDNTTWDLVADMEALRVHLGIERWQVFGGSWGSTLALAYAQSHPERVSELVLRGIFTLRKEELHWFYQEGASWIYPDAWEAYLAPIPTDERNDMIGAYYRRLTGNDKQTQLAAAKAWSQWEGGTVSFQPSPDRLQIFSDDDFALAFARIECHYFYNGGFFKRDDHIIANMHHIRHIPGIIIQGRYDIVTPMKTAWELAQAWPEADFDIVGDAGHAASEPGIVDALIRATDKFAAL